MKTSGPGKRVKTPADTSRDDVRRAMEQIILKSAQYKSFEAMDNHQLAEFAFEHEMLGFSARHHLWNRYTNQNGCVNG